VAYFIRLWQQLAVEHGLKDILFLANGHDTKGYRQLAWSWIRFRKRGAPVSLYET